MHRLLLCEFWSEGRRVFQDENELRRAPDRQRSRPLTKTQSGPKLDPLLFCAAEKHPQQLVRSPDGRVSPPPGRDIVEAKFRLNLRRCVGQKLRLTLRNNGRPHHAETLLNRPSERSIRQEYHLGCCPCEMPASPAPNPRPQQDWDVILGSDRRRPHEPNKSSVTTLMQEAKNRRELLPMALDLPSKVQAARSCPVYSRTPKYLQRD
jgi:hypothetical protein